MEFPLLLEGGPLSSDLPELGWLQRLVFTYSPFRLHSEDSENEFEYPFLWQDEHSAFK